MVGHDPWPGYRDRWDRLWTPHRMAYIRGENRPGVPDAQDVCPFCQVPQGHDRDGLIVARGTSVYALLNLYPYNSGHLLICPYRHVPDYTDLTSDERREFGEFTATAMRVLRAASGAAGFNIGMNQGALAGAGIAGHLHQHVVPRWGGDTNFMPVVAGAKALPQLLEDTQQLLAQAWEGLTD